MRISYLFLFSLLFIWSCVDSVTKQEPSILIGGFRQELRNGKSVSYAKYWKNGQPTDVTDGNKWVFIKCMTVSGNDIYLGGHEREFGQWRTKYWKNGVGVTINEERSYDVECIAVTGSDVYVGGGYKTSKGENFWKNGVPVALESCLIVNAIATVEADVYVAGVSQNNKVAYWKNGAITEISNSYALVTSIAVSGKDVYIAGQIPSPSPSTGYYGIETAVYWKNSNMTELGPGSINYIITHGSDVYAAGYSYSTINTGKVGRYWKNTTPVDIGQDLDLVGIAVDGSDVHAISNNAYWKNQIKSTINSSDSTDYFRTIILK
jgi:hypothetical protein